MAEIRNRLFAVGFAVHMILVGLGACNVSVPPKGAMGHLFALHHWLTGITNFGFYAPNISEQIRDQAWIELSDRQVVTDRLETPYLSREAKIRAFDLINGFAFTLKNVDWKRAYAASMASELFARHPDARDLILRLYLYDVPSMTDALNGSKPQEKLLYEGTFSRGQNVAGSL